MADPQLHMWECPKWTIPKSTIEQLHAWKYLHVQLPKKRKKELARNSKDKIKMQARKRVFKTKVLDFVTLCMTCHPRNVATTSMDEIGKYKYLVATVIPLLNKID